MAITSGCDEPEPEPTCDELPALTRVDTYAPDGQTGDLATIVVGCWQQVSTQCADREPPANHPTLVLEEDRRIELWADGRSAGYRHPLANSYTLIDDRIVVYGGEFSYKVARFDEDQLYLVFQYRSVDYGPCGDVFQRLR
ncbi:MAG: hypothetical protein R3F61_04275 [Myxococcota bacterium]